MLFTTDFSATDARKKFAAYDDYAIKVLKNNIGQYERIQYDNKLIALVANEVDCRLLMLFAIAVLWRASAASHGFYSRVQLGPLEQKAKEIILSGELDVTIEFAAWWSFFDMDWEPAIMDPFRERWSGITAYRFYFGRVIGYFKADKRPIPKEFRDIATCTGRPLVLISRDFQKSKDLKAMHAVLRTAILPRSLI